MFGKNANNPDRGNESRVAELEQQMKNENYLIEVKRIKRISINCLKNNKRKCYVVL